MCLQNINYISIVEWIKKTWWNIYILKDHSAIENEGLPFVTTWVDRGVDIILNKISQKQRKTNTIWSHWYVESIKKFKNMKETHREKTGGCQRGVSEGGEVSEVNWEV